MTHSRKTAPTSKQIAGHWIGRPPPGAASGLPICDVGEPCCFACGWWHMDCLSGCYHGLERAHVIPHASGGSDTDPENFALLCRQCHRDAPDTEDAQWFWHWVTTYPENRNPTLRFLRRMEAAESYLTSDTVTMVNTLGITLPEDRLAEILGVAMTRVGAVTHAGCFSPGTIARILSEAVIIGAKEETCSTPSPS